MSTTSVMAGSDLDGSGSPQLALFAFEEAGATTARGKIAPPPPRQEVTSSAPRDKDAIFVRGVDGKIDWIATARRCVELGVELPEEIPEPVAPPVKVRRIAKQSPCRQIPTTKNPSGSPSSETHYWWQRD